MQYHNAEKWKRLHDRVFMRIPDGGARSFVTIDRNQQTIYAIYELTVPNYAHDVWITYLHTIDRERRRFV